MHPPHQDLADVVTHLADYVQYEMEEGATSTQADPNVVSQLSRCQTCPPPALQSAPTPAPAPVSASASRKVQHAGNGTLEDIANRIASCQGCPLHESRTRTVPGQGASRPELIFIGEGPGASEDEQGLSFVGRAGQLLTKIIEAMGMTRDEVWIGNIVKCRPPGNRVPLPEEMEACLPYLREQLRLLQPKVIVCLGATAVKGLLDIRTGITKLRGQWMSFENIDVMPTYHPAYLLRNPNMKKPVWEDMQEVLRRLGRPIPKQKK